jgi:hypothetical protein
MVYFNPFKRMGSNPFSNALMSINYVFPDLQPLATSMYYCLKATSGVSTEVDNFFSTSREEKHISRWHGIKKTKKTPTTVRDGARKIHKSINEDETSGLAKLFGPNVFPVWRSIGVVINEVVAERKELLSLSLSLLLSGRLSVSTLHLFPNGRPPDTQRN